MAFNDHNLKHFIGDRDGYGRFRITSMMAALARQSGDPEALVEIKRRDLSHSYSYLQIAEIYREAGEHDKALDWAEDGLKAFSQRDSRLVEFLAREYRRRSRHDDAMTLIWNQFVQSPSLKNFQELKAHSQRLGCDLCLLQHVSHRLFAVDARMRQNSHVGGSGDGLPE